uniref:Scavenger receptor class F member 2 n=1 Tax=Magallana gigas TaxID=29159 RepID=K1PJI1_MAGGI
MVPSLYLIVKLSFYDLSYNKVASQSSTVTGNYNDAKNAVDRNVTTCMKTNDLGGSSPRTTVWWKVDLGRIYSINSVNIFFKNYVGYEYRQRGRFAGFSLYVSTTGDIQGSTLCYKDGPQLPPLNFTTQCIEYGRYLFFYNERLYDLLYPQGYEMSNVFTELCEVIVEGCNKRNVYGSNCDIPCPINCKESTCHIVNGSCFGCQSGWSGTYCNEKCKLGWFGENCSRLCVGHCKDGATCNHVTGQCNEGCGTGWKGFICEIDAEEIEKKKRKKKECGDGTYGYGCVNNCSGHCLNDSPCNKQTGYCDRGCNPGYKDDKCSKQCTKSYGENCNFKCNVLCINHTCDRFNGRCLVGCKDGEQCGTDAINDKINDDCDVVFHIKM